VGIFDNMLWIHTERIYPEAHDTCPLGSSRSDLVQIGYISGEQSK
jgi:hypothetical protein